MILKKMAGDTEITGFAVREMASVLLHAAAFSRDIGNVILPEQYTTFSDLVTNRFYNPHLVLLAVPGALKEYDLPDLATALGPRLKRDALK